MRPLLYALILLMTSSSFILAEEGADTNTEPGTLTMGNFLDNDYPWWLDPVEGSKGPLPPPANIEGFILRYVFNCRTEMANPEALWCWLGRTPNEGLLLAENHDISVRLIADHPKQVAKLAGLTTSKKRPVACTELKRGFDAPAMSYTTDSTCAIGRFVYSIHFRLKLLEETVNS